MSGARRRFLTLAWYDVKTVWLPLDVVVQGANALLLAAVLLREQRILHAGSYLALHASIAFAVYMLAKLDRGGFRASDPLTFLHYWLPAVFVLTTYFELGHLIPQLRDYSDHRYDYSLEAVDVWLMGDPVAAIGSIARPLLSDILTVCYVAYYPFILMVPAFLYARGTLEQYQRVATILLVSMLLSYCGYALWPALGPHRLFDAYWPRALDGYGLARVGYHMFSGIPNEPPDAFPSGHALIGMMVPVLAFRFYRALFYWLLPIGLGMVLATIYLRFHYVSDVVAAAVLAPFAFRLGRAVGERFEVHVAEPERWQREAPQTITRS